MKQNPQTNQTNPKQNPHSNQRKPIQTHNNNNNNNNNPTKNARALMIQI